MMAKFNIEIAYRRMTGSGQGTKFLWEAGGAHCGSHDRGPSNSDRVPGYTAGQGSYGGKAPKGKLLRLQEIHNWINVLAHR